jgi:hypothetical protein
MKLARVALWCVLFLGASCKVNGSCGNSDNLLNTRKGEKVVGQWLEKQGMPTKSVNCPRDIKKVLGSNFLCQAVIENSDDLAIDIKITQTNDKGDITMEHASKIQPAAHVERGLAGQILDQTGDKVSVDCGFRVRLAKPGNTFTCTVTAEKSNFQVLITIKDDEGAWAAKKQ